MFKNIRLDVFKEGKLCGYVNTDDYNKLIYRYDDYLRFNMLKFYDSFIIYNQKYILCRSAKDIVIRYTNSYDSFDYVFGYYNDTSRLYLNKDYMMMYVDDVIFKFYSIDLNRYLTSDDFENVEILDLELLGNVDNTYKIINKLKIQQNEKINEQSIKLNSINSEIKNINDLIINHEMNISQLNEKYISINNYISRNSNIMINNLNKLNQNNKQLRDYITKINYTQLIYIIIFSCIILYFHN